MSEPIPLEIPPGIIKSLSANVVGGRYIDGDKVRFVAGKVEKIGGWSKVLATQFESYARGGHAFTDSYGNQHICFGTSSRLYVIDTGESLVNVTPAKSSGTLTNPFTTAIGSAIVTVADIAHDISYIGDIVSFSGASAVGGITIDGEYAVFDIVDADTYKIQHPTAATSSATGGGTVSFEYEVEKGPADATLNTGWGVGRWGEGTWGTARVSASVELEPRIWSIDNYGSNILACFIGSTLYRIDYASDARAAAVLNAPKMRAMFITGERFVFALGAVRNGGTIIDPMCVRWPDQSDITDWIPTSTNTANERRLQVGSKLVGGGPLSALVSLVWSDSALYVFQYTGSSFVYDSRLAGTACGLAGPHAFVCIDDIGFWMSPHGFYFYAGAVRPIPRQEDIRDYVTKNFNTLQLTKASCGYVSRFREIWWIYPSASSSEPDHYVAVNIDTWDWIVGTISRTTICRYRSEEASPVMFGSDGYVYRHEDGATNADGAAMEAYIESGLMKIGNGKNSIHVDGFIPDMERQTGDLALYVYTREHPKGGIIDNQTKVIAEADIITELRVEGRLAAYRITSNALDGDFRMGTNSIEATVGGERP